MDQKDLPLLVDRVERCPKTQDEYTRLNGADSPALETISRSVLICGDAVHALTLLPDQSIQTVVTSPPYWSLRDYDVKDQIGRDDTLDTYVTSIVNAFEAMKRVLRDDGTVWLNVGDSYTSGNRRYRAPDKKNRARAMSVRPPTPKGLKPKDLIGVPWRLAFALQEAGWWVRLEAIWYKPNAHPESVRDRPTKAHETVFLLSKEQNYYAMMPMSLARQCVSLTSREQSVVLDPYAGSGTTLLAARDLGRRWVGIELKSSFADLIERRMIEE